MADRRRHRADGVAHPVTWRVRFARCSSRLKAVLLAVELELLANEVHELVPTRNVAVDALEQLALTDPADASVAYGATEALWVTGRCAESERAVDVLVESAQARGSARGFAMASAMRSWRRYLRGNLRGAEADARTCLDLATEASWALFNPLAGTVLAAVLLERGAPAEAEAVLAPFEMFRNDHETGFVQLLHIKEAELELARGNAEQALTLLALCQQFELDWGANAGLACAVNWRSPSARAQLALGRRSEALAVAEEQVGSRASSECHGRSASDSASSVA
jgi:hypothetical protein